jgi:hypothetical protein
MVISTLSDEKIYITPPPPLISATNNSPKNRVNSTFSPLSLKKRSASVQRRKGFFISHPKGVLSPRCGDFQFTSLLTQRKKGVFYVPHN